MYVPGNWSDPYVIPLIPENTRCDKNNISVETEYNNSSLNDFIDTDTSQDDDLISTSTNSLLKLYPIVDTLADN